MIKTVNISSGTTEQVIFDRVYPYFYIKNLSDYDVYAAIDKMSFSAGDDDVTCVPAQSCCIVYSTFASDTVNIKSNSDTTITVEIVAAYDNNITLSATTRAHGGSGTYDDTAIKADISSLQSGIIDLQTEKADKSEVYTKTETDTKITEKVAEIVADAPEDFDTLKEMSDWIANHENSASAMNSAIQTNTDNLADFQNKILYSFFGNSRKNLCNTIRPDPGHIIDERINATLNTDKSITLESFKTANPAADHKDLLYITPVDMLYDGIEMINLEANVTYVLSGGVSTDISLRLYNANKTQKLAEDFGEGAEYTPSENQKVCVMMVIKGTADINPAVTIYPMLRVKGTDSTYEQYTDDLQTEINRLSARIKALGG